MAPLFVTWQEKQNEKNPQGQYGMDGNQSSANCEGFFDWSVRLLTTYLKVASLIQGVWGAKDGHLPVVEVRLSHQSDAEAFQGLLLQ